MSDEARIVLVDSLNHIIAIGAAAKSLIDGDASTNPDIGALIAAFTAGVGLILAKDSNVTGGTTPA